MNSHGSKKKKEFSVKKVTIDLSMKKLPEIKIGIIQEIWIVSLDPFETVLEKYC